MAIPKELTPESAAFYADALAALERAGIPHLIGGGYALEQYTGIERNTKDADVFLREEDMPQALRALARAGYRSELTFPHWLGKAYFGEDVVDLIFGSGNGIARVDDGWLEHARGGSLFGRPVRLIPPEEMIWSKAFVMERERYDGADIAHIIRALGRELDWSRILERFDENWRVLLAHLVIFGFAYPGERDAIPPRVMRDLMDRLDRELGTPGDERLCRGTLISREQFLVDLEQWGYTDARRLEPSSLTSEELRIWTEDIDA